MREKQIGGCFGKTGGIKKLGYLFGVCVQECVLQGGQCGSGAPGGGGEATSLTKKVFLASPAGGI